MKIKEHKMAQWLPVSEAKNSQRGAFLLIEGGGSCYPDGGAGRPGALAVAIGFRSGKKWHLVTDGDCKEIDGQVKFWMPIPKLPKK